MKNLSLAVIIPTYNRRNILKKCLNALFDQTYPQSDYEVIVVDDGSTDGTEAVVKSMINGSPCILRYFRQENRGPAAARNVGIRNAEDKIILFIGDDIIATPTLLEEHSNWHKQYPDDNVAVLGYVTWSPEIEITPFMKWLERRIQFEYYKIMDKVEVGNYFYTSNISLKRNFLIGISKRIFDEDFPYAAYEDIELGYRLQRRGLKLLFNKSAIGCHYHFTRLEDACQRMIRVGESRGIIAEKMGEKQKLFHSDQPLWGRILSKGKLTIYCVAAKFYERREIKENIFAYVMGHYHLIGVKRYRNKRKRTIGSASSSTFETTKDA